MSVSSLSKHNSESFRRLWAKAVNDFGDKLPTFRADNAAGVIVVGWMSPDAGDEAGTGGIDADPIDDEVDDVDEFKLSLVTVHEVELLSWC